MKDVTEVTLDMSDPFKHYILLRRSDGSLKEKVAVMPDRSLSALKTVNKAIYEAKKEKK